MLLLCMSGALNLFVSIPDKARTVVNHREIVCFGTSFLVAQERNSLAGESLPFYHFHFVDEQKFFSIYAVK